MRIFVFRVKCQIHITVNLFSERLVNIQSIIWNISHLKLMNFIVLIFTHYHIFSHIPKRHTMICIQEILQWNWFSIFSLFTCLNFHIFFLCFNIFCFKGQYICQCYTNDIIFKVLSSVVYCVMDNYLRADYLCCKQTKFHVENKSFENTTFNYISEIKIPEI